MPLNLDQQQAELDIHEFVESDERFHCVLSGAGCGKSFLIEHLRDNYHSTILATTNEASRLIRGTTVHKFFGFGIKNYKEFDGQYDREENYGLIIVDECSMLPTYLFNYIKTMTTLKIVFFGDTKQLVVNDMVDFNDYGKSVLTINMRAKNETVKEIVDYLSLCVKDNVYPSLSEHVGEHLVTYESHKEFLTAIESCKTSYEVLAYRNNLVDKYVDRVGRAKTCFKSQGQTYSEVFIDYSDLISAHTQAKSKFNHPISMDKYLRMLSVSCSRAQDKIHLFIGSKRWR